MVTITDTTLRQSIFETLYDTLTAANLLSSTVTVTAAYIDSDDAPFPQVVIHPVNVEKSDYSFDRSISKKDIVIMIDVWVKKNKDKDSITDEIDAIIDPLKMGGVMLNGWAESNALETPGENKIHLKTITISYLRVS